MFDDEGWLSLRTGRQQRDLRTFELVLSARGIENRVRFDAGNWHLLVQADDLLDGNRELVAYERENVAQPPVPLPDVIDNGWTGVAAYLVVIWSVMVWQVNGALGWNWLELGRLSGAVSGGEWWRLFTALTLHADLGHIAANSLFGAVFGLLVGRLLGSGLGWLCIVLGGALGNLLNVLVRQSDFSSIGASTATFAALGLAAGFAWRSGYFRALARGRGTSGAWRRASAPVFAAVAFFAYTGIGDERTDVIAHACGLLVGFLIALWVASVRLQLAGPRAQRFFGLTAGVLLALAWLSAS